MTLSCGPENMQELKKEKHEPRHEKTYHQYFRPGKTQTGLHSHRS